jgi:hypothetical protein
VLVGGLAAACAIALVLTGSRPADAYFQLQWSQTATGGPAARSFATLALDPLGVDVLFGGSVDGTTAVADTWQYSRGYWIQAAPQTSPPGRVGAVMAFDPDLQRTILFGGYTGGATTNDTWAWDGYNWQPVPTTHAPPPRALAAIAYDAQRHQLVLFGGNSLSSGGAGPDLFGDTWAFDGDWHLLAASGSGPTARSYTAMAYDSMRGVTVLYGGYNGSVLGDTWEWNGISWQPRTPPHSPGPRYQHSMTYDTNFRFAVTFGGLDSADTVSGQTWTYDGRDWTQALLAQSPAPRTLAAMTYNPFTQKSDLFGGGAVPRPGPGQMLGDTWATGFAQPVMTITPSTVDFGQVLVLDTAFQSISIANTGTGALEVFQMQIGGNDPQPFSISADGCTGVLLGQGASCAVQLKYAYAITQSCSVCSAQLMVAANTGTQSVPLTATEAVPRPVKSPSSLDFGNVPIGTTATQAATLSNMGTGDLLISSIYSRGADFGVTSDCPYAPAGLHPGSSCTLQVTFTPTSPYFEYTQIIVLDNLPPGFEYYSVGGTGIAAAPVSLDGPTVSATAPNANIQFGDTVTISASARASDGQAPSGQITFTVNGHALPAVDVGPSAPVAAANVRLDQAVIPDGAGAYAVTAEFAPASSNYTAATRSTTFTVAAEGAVIRYRGGFLVSQGSVPTLAVSIDQRSPAGDSEFVDYSKVPVWVRFDVLGNGVSQSLFVRVANAANWSTSGLGSAQVTPAALPNGAYTVVAHLVAGSGDDLSAPSRFLAGDGVRVGATVSPGTGSYTSGAGYLATDPAANAGDTAGYFAFVGATRSGQVQGSAVYSYRASLNENGEIRDVDVWMSSTSVTNFGPARKGAAQVAGACTISYVDSLTGTVYASTPCNFRITDSEATGAAAAQFAITITAADGSVLHQASGSPAGGAVRVHL